MTFELRDYQADIVAAVRERMTQHKSILIQAPTGSGKTPLATYMVGTAIAKARRAWFIVNRTELVDQTADAFSMVGLPFGYCAAGKPWTPFHNAIICSVDTLRHRRHRLTAPDLVIWDECHHVAARTWSKLREDLEDAWHVGLTATPARLDGKGLGAWFETMVQGPTTAELISRGFLSPYTAFTVAKLDLAGVKTSMGDYARGDLEERVDTPVICNDTVRHYRARCDGARAIVFAVTVGHSEHVAEAFRRAGIAAAHIDGKTPPRDRAETIAAFRRGDVKVLCNVGLVGEGFDLPAVEAAILLRPTKSLALYLQMVGRALRPAEGKDRAIILDCAGNIERHGLPDDPREWSLANGVEWTGDQGAGGAAARTCPKCFAAHSPAPKCPACGHVYIAENDFDADATVELREVSAAQQHEMRLQDDADRALSLARARDERAAREKKRDERQLAYLISLGRKRQYRDPVKWAEMIVDHKKRKEGRA